MDYCTQSYFQVGIEEKESRNVACIYMYVYMYREADFSPA